MGVLTDVFVASQGQLIAKLAEVFTEGPEGHFLHVEGKGLTYYEIRNLWKIAVPVNQYYPDHQILLENCYCEDDGKSISQIPPDLVLAIAAADETQLAQIKLEWFYRGVPPKPDPMDGILPDWFDEFVELLKHAVAQKSRVYVWECP